MPRRRVAIRVEADTETAFVAIAPLRFWLEKNSGGGFNDMLAEMEQVGLLKSRYVQRTLAAGTNIFGGQVPCISIDIGHPALTGRARLLREEVKRATTVERMARL
jgi:hypothetical protein